METDQRILPGDGQESVWDYPRPPRIERSGAHVEVVFGGVTIADSHAAWRILETSHPPVYYIPAADVKTEFLSSVALQTFCEWKGMACYWTVAAGGKSAHNAVWSYPDPTEEYAALKDCFAFYPSKMDECRVDGETVTPQAGDFYGGWITRNIIGPFKE